MNTFIQQLQSFPRNGTDSPEEEFDEKIALAVYTAILSLPISTVEEKNRQFSFLDNINRIIHNYDEVIAVLQDNLGNKFSKRPFSFQQER